jgi:hypothetical protein
MDRQTQQGLLRIALLTIALVATIWMTRRCGPAANQFLHAFDLDAAVADGP